MIAIKYFLLVLIGLGSGFAVASGTFAFITMLGIIPRLAARTRTVRHIVWYETMIVWGGALGNIWIVFVLSFPAFDVVWIFCRHFCRLSGDGTGGDASCHPYSGQPDPDQGRILLYSSGHCSWEADRNIVSIFL